MAANKRNKAQRETDLEEVATLVLKGLGPKAIAERFNESGRPYTLTRQQVHADIKTLYERWRGAQSEQVEFHIKAELAKLAVMESEAWAEWERSKTEGKSTSSKNERGTGKAGAINLSTVDIKREERLGDPQYMKIIQWCMVHRAKLLGLVGASVGDGDGDVSGVEVMVRYVKPGEV